MMRARGPQPKTTVEVKRRLREIRKVQEEIVADIRREAGWVRHDQWRMLEWLAKYRAQMTQRLARLEKKK